MKILSAILIAICVLASAHAEQTKSTVLAARGINYADVTAEQATTLDAALTELKLQKQIKAQTRTPDHAAALLWESINIAVSPTSRACTKYKGYFWFSRLDTAGPDDQTYKSGFAVKIGTGEIYRWEEKQPQQGGPGYRRQSAPQPDP